MLPVVIHEPSIRLFSFYFEGSIYQGMSYQGKLYKLTKSFDAKERLKAYTLGCEISNRNHEVAITVSTEKYRVWVDLATQDAPEALQLDDLVETTGKVQSLQVAKG
ncbi:hypothetical protein H6F88_19420 [Oculatella sp. FACHB-28]|uniref:hypothetical protein n=1 Tax=Oculatella sp. FACHB-28 TaxID=2692845 RepID=UPI00168415E1|nr:hypothetical protein [Oculatella sp. FACHB-28]MBD2058152.1 hypothetical protein [Oculatella sp. FACHB-28]